MHLTSTLVILSSVLITGSLSCQQGYQKFCQWRGTAPVCGNSGKSLGAKVGQETMDQWTKDNDINELGRRGWVTQGCYDEYGESCWSGYKELWCKSTPYLASNEDTVVEVTSGPKHPHQKQTMKIEIDVDLK